MKFPKGQQDELKVNGGYILGTLKGGRRKAGSVLTRSAAVIDADNIRAEQLNVVLQAVAGLGVCYAVRSTAKHSPATPRLRIIIFFATEIGADKYAPVVRRICQLIQPELTWFDPSTDEAGRLMYWASHCQDVEPVFIWGEGQGLLDAEALLKQLPDWRDPSCWPRFPREQTPARLAAKQEDPTEKKGVVGAFCRCHGVLAAMEKFLPGVYEPTDLPDRYTYVAGSTAGGALVYEDGKFLYSHHATDPAGGHLVNAFDLVRLHKFGDLDDDAKEGTPINRLPSYAAMYELARSDPAVSETMAREAFAAAAAESAPEEEDAALGLGRCAGEYLSLDTVRLALRAFGITAKNNLITGKAEITGLPEAYSKENAINTLPVFLVDKLRAIGIKGVSKTTIIDYLAMAFIGYLAMHLKTAFAEAAGYRSKRQQRDPIQHAASLDAPIPGEDDLYLGDAVADDSAQAAFENAEHRMYLEQLHGEMESALAQLTAQQADILRRRHYKGETLQAIGDDLQITQEGVRQIEGRALRYLHRPKILSRLYRFAYPEGERRIDARTDFYHHVGVNRFSSTGSSAVEELVLKREEWRQWELDQEDREADALLARADREIERILKAAPWLREKVEALRSQDGEVKSWQS